MSDSAEASQAALDFGESVLEVDIRGGGRTVGHGRHFVTTLAAEASAGRTSARGWLQRLRYWPCCLR